MKFVTFHAINREQIESMKKSPLQLKNIQNHKIQKIIKHAYETVPYYYNLFGKHNLTPDHIRNNKDLQLIPVSTKQDFLDAGDSIISSKFMKSNLYLKHTGGSSGKTLVFYQTYQDECYAGVSYDRARIENGFSPLFNKITFVGPYKTESALMKNFKYKWTNFLKLRRTPLFIDMSDNQSNIEKILSNNKYDSIKGFPSFLYLLALKVNSGHLKMPDLKHVFTASEMLDEKTRCFINNTFHTDLIDIYGCWEGGCIAWECEKHEGYHINIDFVALQIVDNNNISKEFGTGNLIITNLNSFAVPFIRYQLNDIVELTPDICSCGKPFPLIKSILGRRDDFIVLTNGHRISPSGLLVVMHAFSDNVMEFQIIQEKVDELQVRIVVINDANRILTEDEIKKGLENHLNDKKMKITVATVHAIDRTPSFKLKSIISNIQ
jgi:phenylacetate-CoA ligase